jgi:hypothetical protein
MLSARLGPVLCRAFKATRFPVRKPDETYQHIADQKREGRADPGRSAAELQRVSTS